MIEGMVESQIVSSYDELTFELQGLNTAFSTFSANPSAQNKEELKQAWLNAYTSWQGAALWTFGPSETNGLITAMNIYPTDTVQIEANITGSYDLNSISQIDAQGFPALEYLLFGNVDLSDSSAQAYFSAVLQRMETKVSATKSSWETYAADFAGMTGTDQGSALGILFNYTLLPYIEVHQREAKFGIPGGQRTGTPQPTKVEGYYSRTTSKVLALTAFNAYRAAWMGSSNDTEGRPTLLDYLAYMDNRNSTDLAGKLQTQLDDIQLAIEGLDDDFYQIAQSNPQTLNDVWAKYQIMVFTIKTEVSSSLNVTISYVDSDGD